MGLTAKNVLVNLRYYAITLWLLPWLALSIEAWLGVSRHPAGPLRLAAVMAGAAGALLQLWCIVLFQRIGKGTPSPSWPELPPRRLVTQGPYGVVRNPMNWGELLVFAALAAWFGSPLLWLYAAGSWLAFHLFLIGPDEEGLRRKFGAEYEAYRARVPRWWPRLA